ncbi:MAG TPA: TraR/DksA C4-type zinc finger protein [Pyrinomonadaceae bacterium]|nr:TraR/DksA C4-type zinc finger protein [Pyrinomonadaceae bacterium]
MGNLQQIKHDLTVRKSELLERLNRVQNHLRHKDNPLDDDFAEQAVERENDQVLEALEANMHEEVLKINHAILLMEAGKYGICENCQQPIAEKRLAALPFTTVCIGCAV